MNLFLKRVHNYEPFYEPFFFYSPFVQETNICEPIFLQRVHK